MKLERRHGLLGLTGLGIALGTAVLSQLNLPSQSPDFVPAAVRADWEGIDYPALDRVISARAAAARAKDSLKLASR